MIEMDCVTLLWDTIPVSVTTTIHKTLPQFRRRSFGRILWTRRIQEIRSIEAWMPGLMKHKIQYIHLGYVKLGSIFDSWRINTGNKSKFKVTCKFLTPLLDVVLKHPIEINKMTAMIAVTIKFRGWSGIKSSVHSSIAPHKPLKKMPD